MKLYIATSNKGKIKEFENLLSDINVELHTPADLEFYSSPEENGDSFVANARIKAKSLAAMVNDAWVVADDSGLECEGLEGMPGIHSARYAGANARDAENTAKVLKMISLRTKNRNARFVCALVAIDPDGNEHIFEGELKGSIASKQSGQTGFGYDPIFIPTDEEKTLAELGPAVKNRLSHRAKAIKVLKEELRKHL